MRSSLGRLSDSAMRSEPTGSESSPSLEGLSFLWLEITEKCNLECSHCYADSGPRRELYGEMRLENWYAVIQESADLGCREIQFIGGEPTLHPDLGRLVDCASACGYTFIEVFTNATVFSDSLYRVFLRSQVQVATSFYSNDPTIHDQITRSPGSFLRTVNGIKQIINIGLRVRAGIIETKMNAGHGQKAQSFLNDLGISDIKVDFQRGVGRGAEGLYSPDPTSQLCGECWKGKLCVTPSGTAYPCVFSRFAQLGKATNGIRHIIEGDELLAFRTNLRELQRARSAGEQGVSRLSCNPTCSPCGPENFIKCQPGWTDCAPAENCNPLHAPLPCAPDRCNPSRTCLPDSRCGPLSR